MKYPAVIFLFTLSVLVAISSAKFIIQVPIVVTPPTPATTTETVTTPAPATAAAASVTPTTPSAALLTTTKAPIKWKLCWRGNNWCNLPVPTRRQRCKSFFGVWKCY